MVYTNHEVTGTGMQQKLYWPTLDKNVNQNMPFKKKNQEKSG